MTNVEEKVRGIEETVRKIISEQLSVNSAEVAKDSRIVEDLGADSLDGLEIIMKIEDAYESMSLKISDEAARELKTVGNIINYVADYLSRTQ